MHNAEHWALNEHGNRVEQYYLNLPIFESQVGCNHIASLYPSPEIVQ